MRRRSPRAVPRSGRKTYPPAGLVSPAYEAVLVPTHDGRIPVTTRRFIRGAQGRNLFVAAWTINDPETMATLARRGIDGIITDRPDLGLSLDPDAIIR